MLSRVLIVVIFALLISNVLTRWDLTRAREDLALIKAAAEIETRLLKNRVEAAELRSAELQAWINRPTDSAREDFKSGECRP